MHVFGLRMTEKRLAALVLKADK